MTRSELETVLANWIGQALTPPEQLPQGVDPAKWAACRFAEWWGGRVGDVLAEAETAAAAIRDELTRLGGWESLGEAMHEHIHLQQALGELRALLGLAGEQSR